MHWKLGHRAPLVDDAITSLADALVIGVVIVRPQGRTARRAFRLAALELFPMLAGESRRELARIVDEIGLVDDVIRTLERSPRAYARRTATDELAEIASERAVPALEQALGDRDRIVRITAVRALAAVPRLDRIERMTDVLDQDSSAAPSSAISALLSLASAAPEALAGLERVPSAGGSSNVCVHARSWRSSRRSNTNARFASHASPHSRALPIISGGFGIFRRDALLAVGGYTSDTIGEDFDTTLRIHRHYTDSEIPDNIQQIPNVVCWTMVPDSRRVLRRQRMRWHRGLGQVLSKHKGMLFRWRYGWLGWLAVPWAWGYELINPFVAASSVIVTVIWIAAGWVAWQGILIGGFITWAAVVAPTLASLLMTDYPGETARGWRNLGAIVGATFIEVGYQVLTLTYRIASLFRRRVEWGEMERSTAKVPPPPGIY